MSGMSVPKPDEESTDSVDGQGPIYGVPLLDSLGIGRGAMRQALPSRDDLDGIKDFRQGQRVVAGYEVLLWHYRRQQGIANVLADELAKRTGTTVPCELEKAESIVDTETDNDNH